MLPVKLIRRKSSIDSCENSFLQEIEYNNNISKEIREVVEYRFKLSKINSNYVFPRKKVSSLDLFLKEKRSKSQSFKNTKSTNMKNSLNNTTHYHLPFTNIGLQQKIKTLPKLKTLSLSFLDKHTVGFNPNLRKLFP